MTLRSWCSRAALWCLSLLWVSTTLAASGAGSPDNPVPEPSSLTRAVKAAPAASAQEALRAAGLAELCQGALPQNTLDGVRCRLAVQLRLLTDAPLQKDADVDAVAAQVRDVDAFASALAAHKAPANQGGFAAGRFEAHRAACDVVLLGYDRLRGAQGPGAARAAAVLEAFPATPKGPARTLKEAACGCVSSSIALGTGANAADAVGELQRVMTARSCSLDDSRMRADRADDPAQALARSQDARALAATTSEEGKIRAYAQSRDLDLSRCRDKSVDAKGQLEKGAGPDLEKCACGAIGRWRFPHKKGDAPTAATLPLVAGQELPIVVGDGGKVSQCGPLKPTAP